MQFLIAPASFKGSMSAVKAASCMAAGFRRVFPRARIRVIPLADGGEGTVEALLAAMGGRLVRCRARDPLGRRISARFGLCPDGTAVIEMAEASGLIRLRARERNPLRTTTAGTGDLIRAALAAGATRILLGIGGSATNDGGMGMARALGVRFQDDKGCDLPEGGGALRKLARIDMSGLDPRLKRVRLSVACDVRNLLFGRQGAAFVYGPQKGATPAMVRTLDLGLKRLAQVIRRQLGRNVAAMPGAGAAGGLGAGLVAFAGGRLIPGAQLVLETVHFEKYLRTADVVITGEGRLDGQTACGKAISEVARQARRHNVPVIAIGGCAGPGADEILKLGVSAYFTASEKPLPEADLKRRGPGMLTRCAETTARQLKATWATRSAARGSRRRPVPS